MYSRREYLALRREAHPVFLRPISWICVFVIITSFGVLQRPPVLPVNLTYLSFLILLLLLFGRYVLKSKYSVHPTSAPRMARWAPSDSLILIMLLASLASTWIFSFLFGFEFNLKAAQFTFPVMLGLYFICRHTISFVDDVSLVVRSVILASILASLIGLILYLINPYEPPEFLGHSPSWLQELYSPRRLKGLQENPNRFAQLPMIGFLLSVNMLVGARRKRVRVLYFLIASELLLSIFLSFSRAAWLGTFVGLFLFSLVVKRSGDRQIIGMIIVIGSLALLLLFTTPDALLKAGLGRLNYTFVKGVLASRQLIWRHVLDVLLRFPVLGVGLGNYHRASLLIPSPVSLRVARQSVHNSILALLVETGWLGGGAFALLILAQLRLLMRSFRYAEPRSRYSIAIGIALAATWTANLTHSMHGCSEIWVLSACLTSLSQRPWTSRSSPRAVP